MRDPHTALSLSLLPADRGRKEGAQQRAMPPPVSVPVRLVHEAEGHIVTCELVTGELYRGLVVDTEDNMNLQLKNVTLTARDGRVTKLQHVYLRGSKIRFMILPDMLKNAPMFKRLDPKHKGAVLGIGRGVGGVGRGARAARGRGRGR